MKKWSALLVLVISWLWVAPSLQPVYAYDFSGTPYTTYTAGLNNQLVYSAPAYEATSIINYGFSNPTDIFIDDRDYVFIADTGNHRIVEYHPQTQEYVSIGEDVLEDPQGLFVTEEAIYVADSALEAIVKFDLLGNVVQTIERPTSLLYGEEFAFRPTKIVVDARTNLFVISDGNSNGIIQLNELGDFVRYFGANTVSITPELLIRRMFLSEEQRDLVAPLTPRATSNLAIDSQNVIYSIIYNDYGVSMKKINVVGTNILNGNSFFQPNYVDISVDDKGYIYTISEDFYAAISVYDRAGNLLFRFGVNEIGDSLLGQFDMASGIATDSSYNIWALDKLGNNVQVFVRNEFASTVIGAIDAYEEGYYELSESYYERILQQNNNFTLAYIGLGKIYQRNNEYEKALEVYRISNYSQGYSEVFWEYRDQWISANIYWFLVAIIMYVIFRWWFRRNKNKSPTYQKMVEWKNKVKNYPVVIELSYLVRILKDPKDVFYDIKYRLSIRWSTAIGIFIAFIFINIISDNFIRSTLFRPVYTNVELSLEILRYGLVFIIFVIANQLMSSLQNGEGFFRDIFIGGIIAMAPVILFKVPLDLLSNALTYNEQFIFWLGNLIILSWTTFLILYMVKEIHNYKVSELITNLLLTLFTTLILVVIYLVLYVMFGQVIQFAIGLWEEWQLR